MLPRHRAGAAFGALSLLVLSSCVGSDVVSPDPSDLAPLNALVDGSTGGNDDFFFLPPLVFYDPPVIEGVFNPDLRPSVEICETVALDLDCVPGQEPVATFAAGTATIGSEAYQVEWDTGASEDPLSVDKIYRVQVFVADVRMGYVDMAACRSTQPGECDPPGTPSPTGALRFDIGDVLPINFWLGLEALCEGQPFVTECVTNVVVDESGADIELIEGGNKLGVIIFEGSLPGDDGEEIVVTVERIDPEIFANTTGTECLPLFDAPQFADCFRITTDPVLTEPLAAPALVSICLDPTLLDGIDLPAGQENQLTMVRFDDLDEEWEALPDAAGDCPATEASLLRVPESGLMRYAALGINAVADFLGPEPLLAKDIRFGGFSSSFSRFRYALPGQMIPGDADGTLIQPGDDPVVPATFEVVDHEGLRVENAIVHLDTDDGTLSASEAVTDASGIATVTWTVEAGTPGDKVLTASARGLLAGPVPEHADNFFFVTESVTTTVTVVGPPAMIVTDPDEPVTGTAGESAGELTIQVTDAAGNPVAGAEVTWSGDGNVIGGDETGEDGAASAEWILPEQAGEKTVTATVGDVSATFDATVLPGPAVDLAPDPLISYAPAGSVVTLSIRVTDAFGNPRPGDAVQWSVTGGGGSLTADDFTGADGAASAALTLGELPGLNSVLVHVGDLEAVFRVEGQGCVASSGTATIDGVFGADEWQCAGVLPFTTNLGGGHVPAEALWMNDGSNLYLAVRVQTSARRALRHRLRIDFDNDGDGMAERNDDVIEFDPRRERFTDAHLPARCLNRGQSACSRDDRTSHGSGAAEGDDGWVTFELSHPLSGGGAQDISVEAGDRLGFFLTFLRGNGATSNTQVPGFRQYLSITIAGS